MSDSERRQYPRVLLNGRCWCEAKDVSVFAQVGNVSEGGLFVRTQIALPTGTRATVRFHLGENGPEHEAEAVVVWGSQSQPGSTGPVASPQVGPPGMGLRFTRLEPDLADGIRTFVQVAIGQEP